MEIPAWLRKKPTSDKPRIHFLDELRGAAVLAMILYHGLYTFSEIYRFAWCVEPFRYAKLFQPLIPLTFLLVSGISANLSRSNFKRGAKLTVVAACVTLATLIATPQQAIWFGILHLLSVAMMLSAPLLPLLNKLPVWPSIAACGALFAFTANVWDGYLGFFSIPLIPLPDVLYETNWLCWLGVYSPTFQSADYFPLLPWIFVFFGGVFLGRYARAGKFPKWTYRRHVPFLSFFGRHALVLYVVHQPVFLGIGLLLNAVL